MAIRLEEVLVVDIEATCWDDPLTRLNQFNEIIEVGITILPLRDGVEWKSESIIVKPVNSTISDFCTELTTLTQEDVDKGVSLEKACQRLQDTYVAKKRLWASYGNYDRKMFIKECINKGIEYPFSDWHLNVKTLVAMKLRLDKEVGMAEALQMLDIPLEGTHHRGVDDSKNIAKILQWCL